MNLCPVCNKSAKNIYCSLSCSNIARAKKWNIRKINEDKYYKSPKLCKHCSFLISYDKRVNDFCSQTCGAIFNNSHFPKRIKKYCEPKLSMKERTMIKFNNGEINTRGTIRRIFKRLDKNCCEICTLKDSWNDKPLILIIDHIDGNAGNNFPSNLRLLCPNCNSQTDTFSGRNKGYGRQSRGLPR